MDSTLMEKAHAMVGALNRATGSSVTVSPQDEARHVVKCIVSENDLRRILAKCGVDVDSVLRIA